MRCKDLTPNHDYIVRVKFPGRRAGQSNSFYACSVNVIRTFSHMDGKVPVFTHTKLVYDTSKCGDTLYPQIYAMDKIKLATVTVETCVKPVNILRPATPVEQEEAEAA